MNSFHVREIVHVEGEEGGTKLKRRANNQPTNKSLIEKKPYPFYCPHQISRSYCNFDVYPASNLSPRKT